MIIDNEIWILERIKSWTGAKHYTVYNCFIVTYLQGKTLVKKSALIFFMSFLTKLLIFSAKFWMSLSHQDFGHNYHLIEM